MDKLNIPISWRKKGLHQGHISLINFAKEISDDVTIILLPDFLYMLSAYTGKFNFLKPADDPDIHNFFRNRLKQIDNKDDMMIQQIIASGCKYMIPIWLFEPIPQDKLTAARNQAYILVMDKYADFLVNQHQIEIAEALIVRDLTLPLLPGDFLVRGPELDSFFLKDLPKYIVNSQPTLIMPEVIKNPGTGLKQSGNWDLLSPEEILFAEKLKSVIDEIMIKATPDNNVKNSSLKLEINNSYSSVPWIVQDIVVHEGGLVDGRLEAVFFKFPNVTIEDTTYIPGK